MKFKIVLLLSILSFIFTTASAQDQEDKLNIGVSLNHDAFFGFNPMLTGSYAVNEKTAFTFYGIQWGAGTGRAWGNWTEFGIGLNKKVGDFNINPQLGFTKGSLLSSGAGSRGIVGDGIVPNLTVNYGSKKMEGQFYGGYYGALRDNTIAKQSTNNYVHYWANLGVKATSWFSVGAHFENLYLSGGKTNGGGSLEKAEGYTWIGPYIQFSKGNAGTRLSLGANTTKDEGFAPNDFYKLAFFMNF
ncbi:hypothetical protein MCERE19_03643 [Spirosomataceae bacterium]